MSGLCMHEWQDPLGERAADRRRIGPRSFAASFRFGEGRAVNHAMPANVSANKVSAGLARDAPRWTPLTLARCGLARCSSGERHFLRINAVRHGAGLLASSRAIEQSRDFIEREMPMGGSTSTTTQSD
jgi:hypothetical protein